MKSAAEKCAERILAVKSDLLTPRMIRAIIQSEYAPKSPDKCAEQAAAKIAVGLVLPDAETFKIRVAAIITESYAPTIQVAREAIKRTLKKVGECQIQCRPDELEKCVSCELRNALK